MKTNIQKALLPSKCHGPDNFYVAIMLALQIAFNISVTTFWVNSKWMQIFKDNKQKVKKKSVWESTYSPIILVCMLLNLMISK